jgi:hypothetical protein
MFKGNDEHASASKVEDHAVMFKGNKRAAGKQKHEPV